MNNKEIARVLRNVAACYILKDEKKFRFQIIAYQRAADAIEHAISEIKDLWEEGRLTAIPGIGPSIAKHLDELFRRGKVKHFEELTKGIPPSLFELLYIPGMGPKRAYRLVKTLRITKAETAIQELEKKAMAHEIAKIEGFGEKSEADILTNIKAFRRGQIKENRMVLPYAYTIAQDVLAYLRKIPEVIRAEPLGSLRRMTATIGDVDIAVATNDGLKVLDYFCKYPKAKRILEKGEATASLVLENGRQVDLMIQPPESFGALLQHFTGSKHHNIHLREYALKKGLSLSEYGIKTIKENQKYHPASWRGIPLWRDNSKLKIYQFSSEESFYNAIGLSWIPPELREDTGEIEAAETHKLPKLVTLEDIKGDLHVHSSYNIEPSHDLGAHSMEEMVKKTEELGYEYLGLSEHSPSISNHTKQEIINIIKKRKEYIEQLKYSREKVKNKRTVKILNSMEVDILSNGSLSVSDEGLELLDFYIVAVHSSFNQPKEEMTKRVLFGLSHKGAKILGHPTGRLLGQREGYELNWEKIFDFCLKERKALEINAYPDRLDLPDVLVKEAVKKGIKLVINTDSHAKEQMDLMFYGVAVARRGWAKASDILNTLSYNELIEWTRQ